MQNFVKIEPDGLTIGSYIQERMETFRTGGDSDQPLTFREIEKKTGVSFTLWNALETGRRNFVSWKIWELIYKALVNGPDGALIDPEDVELMPPSVLRERLRAIKEAGPAVVGSGNININSAVGNHASNSIMPLLDRSYMDVVDAIIDSDMCGDCKVKACKIIRKIKKGGNVELEEF